MSQKPQSDGGQKHFAVGRGLLAAAETLNFNMNEQRPARQAGGMASGMGVGGGAMEGNNGSAQMSRLGSGNNLGSTMKLFASLGLSPSDLDALAEIPEEDISVETLPHILRQLKSRKGDVGKRRPVSSMSSEVGYQEGRDSWAPSLSQTNFGYSSLQDAAPSYGMNYSGASGGSRERLFSELSQRDSYGGLGMGTPSSDPLFMPRRIGPPPHRKVQDFLGVMPPTFPHVCSLCDFDVRTIMEWNQHTDGLRHAENRRLLLDMYPDWDPGMPSSRGGGLLETPNLAPGLLGPAPMSSAKAAGGMSSSWGGGAGLSGKNQLGQTTLRSRVVVVKYDRKPLSTKTLFAFAEPFGIMREHLVLKNKAFFEMSSHEEALDMVSYYEQNPASLYGKPLTIYLSKRLLVIEKDDRASDRPSDRPSDRLTRDIRGYDSQVVFFSNLPREEEKKMELLTIAARFGIVEKHLFLTDQAFIQLGTPEDAHMLVKYYSQNPLTIKGRSIRLNICTKYKTLNVNRRQGGAAGDSRGAAGDGRGAAGDGRGQRSSRPHTTSSSSGTRTSSSSLRTSSSKSSSSSRSREERKKKEEEENKTKPEEKPAAEEKKEEKEEEEEEEVSGVMEGEEEGGEEQVDNGDAEGEEPEGAETVEETEEAKQEEAPGGDDVTDDTPGEVGGADGEIEKEAEAAVPTEAADTDEAENKEEQENEEERENTGEPSVEPGESSEMMEESEDLDQDFLENMEDFVTLDELAEDEDESNRDSDGIDHSRKGGMRVVNIVGFRRGYKFKEELLSLAKPFGKVVKYLILDLKPEAYLQFETEEEARAMSKFYYNTNVKVSVCGRPVRISHSMTYPTVQCGSSTVVYLGQIPSSKYTDEAIIKLAEPYGKIKKYFLNRIKKECFIEMERAQDAEKMAEDCRVNPLKFSGKRLTVYVSRKYKHLKYGHRYPISKRESSSSPPKSTRHSEEPPAKKSREEKKDEEKKDEEKEMKEEEQKEEEIEEQKAEEEKPEEGTQSADVDEKKDEGSAENVPEVSDQGEKMSQDLQENKQEALEDDMETSTNENGETEAAQNKSSVATLPLPPHDPETPIGVEHVKMGYYCRVCFLFYSNEDSAKKTHCSTKSHYDKLQKHLEKEQAKAEKKKGKKN
ncbi:matrin 3-like 1.2 isoform X2 [Cheilinus undulatus]|uniref:matrin 3-like 1.2 isoform X2 n=1 Tax=Cheilinus undulatus TaxID=241271 RepID=UPI001BD1F1D2|nr:matrin 3-like 1.2 isoform X2 [Cheilinus undulatus]